MSAFPAYAELYLIKTLGKKYILKLSVVEHVFYPNTWGVAWVFQLFPMKLLLLLSERVMEKPTEGIARSCVVPLCR